MLKLTDNNKLRNEMSLNARERATRYFSKDSITLEILKLYKELINE